MTSLAEQYADEVQAILAKYPPEQKRSAVMPLLALVQRRDGFVSKAALQEVAQMCGITSTETASIVGFYSLYHDEKKGTYRIQVCTDLCCALRGADEFLHGLCEGLGIPVGGTTPDGKITVEAVMCLAACDKAPMFQVQALGSVHHDGLEYHENQTVESALRLIEELRQK